VAERRYVEDGLLHDVRNDGRSRLDFRPIVLQSSLIPQVRCCALRLSTCVRRRLATPHVSSRCPLSPRGATASRPLGRGAKP
jgi:hypothetical protein